MIGAFLSIGPVVGTLSSTISNWKLSAHTCPSTRVNKEKLIKKAKEWKGERAAAEEEAKRELLCENRHLGDDLALDKLALEVDQIN